MSLLGCTATSQIDVTPWFRIVRRAPRFELVHASDSPEKLSVASRLLNGQWVEVERAVSGIHAVSMKDNGCVLYGSLRSRYLLFTENQIEPVSLRGCTYSVASPSGRVVGCLWGNGAEGPTVVIRELDTDGHTLHENQAALPPGVCIVGDLLFSADTDDVVPVAACSYGHAILLGSTWTFLDTDGDGRLPSDSVLAAHHLRKPQLSR
jgi:hypothetical protein